MPASWTSRGSVLIRLARQHFAFYRGYLDGLDLRLLAERYPGGELIAHRKDLGTSSGKALLGWITEHLVIEAERCGQRSAARVLRLQPLQVALANQHGSLPTLAEFQEERDPYHMYSEGELLELFELEYPGRTGRAERIAQRNRRLRRRQEAVLQLIESRVKLEPALDDPVTAWIDSGLANYLVKADITTLGQLHSAIESHGFHWYRKVPRIGVKAARHITSWLLLPTTGKALGVTISARGTTPPRKIDGQQIGQMSRGLDVLPLERLVLPDSLNGLTGTNRGAVPSIQAANDIEAIEAWLLKMKPGSHTARACRKEAERFLLWCVLEAQKPFSSAGPTDVQAYLHFLSHLGRLSANAWGLEHRLSQESWLGRRGVDRWSVRWRPFEGPLAVASLRAAMSLLKSLMSYLYASGYLRSDPFAEAIITLNPAVAPGRGKRQRKPVLHDEWEAAWSYMQSQPVSPQLQRVKVILLLLKETGCRLQRLASLRRDSLARDGRDWYLQVAADNIHPRKILLSEGLHDALLINFRYRGFHVLDSVPSSAPLVTALPKNLGADEEVEGLSGARIYKVLKDYFAKVADEIGLHNVDLACRLRQISADSFLRSE